MSKLQKLSEQLHTVRVFIVQMAEPSEFIMASTESFLSNEISASRQLTATRLWAADGNET